MKALAQKDLEFLAAQKKFFLLLAGLFVLLSHRGQTAFSAPYLLFSCGILTVSTLSAEELDHGQPFLFALPLTRRGYVLEKYLLMLSLIFGTCLVSLALWSLSTLLPGSLSSLPAGEALVGLAGSALGLVLANLLLLPVSLHFGSSKGRLAMIALFAGIGGLAYAAVSIFPQFPAALEAMLRQNRLAPWQALGLAAVGIAALFALSFGISVHIMQKKEF